MTRYTRRRFLAACGFAGTSMGAGCLVDGEDDGDQDGDDADGDGNGENPEIRVEEVVTDLAHPWGRAFLPEGDTALVTERPGRLLAVTLDDGAVRELAGVPEVFTGGQGGLLDVTVHPDFGENPWVYLTYAIEQDAGTTTAFGRGELGEDELETFEQLYAVEPFVEGNGHFGSRVRFGPDGSVYVTTGDRQSKEFGEDHYSQDLSTPLGSLMRFEPDGSIPGDNPFVDDPDTADPIFSYGIRNAQGLTVHPETEEIWLSDHGEQDGDAIHITEAAANHGWPIATYACTYTSGAPIEDEPHERDDVVDPVHYWECNSGGFPPAGMSFYDGEAFPAWQGDLFVGTLAGEYLGRFRVDGRDVTELDPLLEGRGWRMRDVAVHPDGDLYVLVDDASAPLVRLTPA